MISTWFSKADTMVEAEMLPLSNEPLDTESFVERYRAASAAAEPMCSCSNPDKEPVGNIKLETSPHYLFRNNQLAARCICKFRCRNCGAEDSFIGYEMHAAGKYRDWKSGFEVPA